MAQPAAVTITESVADHVVGTPSYMMPQGAEAAQLLLQTPHHRELGQII